MNDLTVSLDIVDCLALLATQSFGRVAVNHPDGPVVLPVNYVVDRGSVVFRTGPGTTLQALTRHQPITFQTDCYHPSTRTGWSVMVRGRPEEIWQSDELDAVRRLGLQPAAGGDRHWYVRLLSTAITGRRIRASVPDDSHRIALR